MDARRRSLAVAATLGGLLTCFTTWVEAQSSPQQAEATLRSTIDEYIATWNKHDVAAWSALLTEDIWYTEAIDFYQRMKGKSAVLSFHGDTVKTMDIAWDVKKIKLMPDGTATVVVRHTAFVLPKNQGKYSGSFASDPSVSRWRLVDGKWRMFYFTSHKGTALDVIAKDGAN